MLLKSLNIPRAEFESATGWALKPEGACKNDICIPIPHANADIVHIPDLAAAMNLPLAAEPEANLWALGPDSIGGRALSGAKAPELTLPDRDGKAFSLSSLLGKKVLIYAWAPY